MEFKNEITDTQVSTILAAKAEVQTNLKNTLYSGYKYGVVLNKAKDSFGHGYWGEFCRDTLEESERQVRKYMQLAREYPTLAALKAHTKAIGSEVINDVLKPLPTPEEIAQREANEKWTAQMKAKIKAGEEIKFEEKIKIGTTVKRKPTPHEILGITPLTKETLNIIKKGLSAKYHPDKPRGGKEKMAAINNACDQLAKMMEL